MPGTHGLAKLAGRSTWLSAVTPQAEDNLVDCAIAEPLNVDDVRDEILDIGQIAGISEGSLRMSVKKAGAPPDSPPEPFSRSM